MVRVLGPLVETAERFKRVAAENRQLFNEVQDLKGTRVPDSVITNDNHGVAVPSTTPMAVFRQHQGVLPHPSCEPS